MALTPFRIVILVIATLVFSILGVVLIAMGVHGPDAIAILGGFFLLPSIVLIRLGVPVGIPFMQSMSILSVVVFVVLQTAYYYALFQLVYLVLGHRRRKTPV